ncbi:hypothetical protein [Sulfitobacter sp. S190]|uniref:hypothetical protein n=1 Tax=Sulfitobacter sp. S190 TaxID=2867022 RepID=UPI0021A8FFC8|nr:hypothetical protein [Sulfitobacter sp. S190]UWR22877.1 hypothetical protein K3756_02435 [Sulfitobacter sp. S190]
MRLLLTLLACPTALLADFAVLAGDVPLSRTEVVALTAGPDLAFFAGGVSRYSAGGAYSFTYDSGQSAFGTYDVGPDGVICIAYRNGRSRCDRFVRSHGRLVMLTQAGDRFPVRP